MCPDGTIFEGNLVDNHFDPSNLQTYYRMTSVSGEVYEGSFCDEARHGVGKSGFSTSSVLRDAKCHVVGVWGRVSASCVALTNVRWG